MANGGLLNQLLFGIAGQHFWANVVLHRSYLLSFRSCEQIMEGHIDTISDKYWR